VFIVPFKSDYSRDIGMRGSKEAVKEPKCSIDVAARLYHGTSGRRYHDHKRALCPDASKSVMALRAEKFQPHICSGDTVFEFGVGSGLNLGQLRCARRIGCDTSEFLAERIAALGIEFVTDVAQVSDEIADVVICHHTLEHLLEPARLLAELSRILKRDGKLILHVPWDRDRQFSRYRADEPDHHLYTWNPQSIGNLARILGYEIQAIGVRKYGYDRFAANLSGRLHFGYTGFRVIRSCLVALRPRVEVELIAVRL